VPGSIHIFIGREWRKFILTFIGMELVLAIAVWLGVSLQSGRSFSFPQGVCPGALALLILVPLFLSGQKSAIENNKVLGDEDLYQSRKPVSQDNEDEQFRKIQKMRDEGLISKQQYEHRKSKVIPKK
jgi:hypothetical protein